MSLWQLASEISRYFGVNVLVFDDIKDKPVYADIQGVTLTQVLASICWYLDCEYVVRDGIYYIGSGAKTILVLPASGLPDDVEGIFKDVTIKVVNDKVVCYGTEKDVAKVQAIYDQLTEQQFCTVHLYAVEISRDRDLQIGVDLSQSVEYAFSWENLLENGYNPIQSLAVSLYASIETDDDYLRVSSLIDTDLGLMSGAEVSLQVGQDQDRAVYSESDSGERVISSYSTQETGLLLELQGSWASGSWIIDFHVEDSDAKSDLVKTVTELTTKAQLSESRPVCLLCHLVLQDRTESFSVGVPFLDDIPYLGYLFRMSEDKDVSRDLFFVLALLPKAPSISLPSSKRLLPLPDSCSPLLQLSGYISGLF